MDTTSNRSIRGRPKAWDDKTEQNTIKSLDRAMAVLDHLSALPGARLSDIASNLGQSAATVYRILVTLENRELVELDAEAQLWHVGPKAFLIGTQYLRRTSVVERARPILRQLMEEAGETANLAIPRHPNVLFVNQVECDESIRAFFPPGTLSPMHASGIGKALLAQMTNERVEQLISEEPLTQFTEHTLTEADGLKANLKAIRERGYAIDDEEKNIGMRCIAAPVFDWQGDAVAGISVSGPVSRVSIDQTERLAASVIRAASNLSAALGSTPNVNSHSA